MGKTLYNGVLVRVRAQPGRTLARPLDDDDRLQALWLFSSDACGVYGTPGVSITRAGRTDSARRHRSGRATRQAQGFAPAAACSYAYCLNAQGLFLECGGLTPLSLSKHRAISRPAGPAVESSGLCRRT